MTAFRKYKSHIFLFTLFILSVIFRLIINHYNPQPYIFDQYEYHSLAVNIINKNDHIYLMGYRLAGYPLILAVIYAFFGMKNTFAWILFHSILEGLTVLLVFFLAHLTFKKKVPAYFASIIYAFNPFTSAYVGVRLTEVTAIFFVTCSIFLLMFNIKKKNSYILLLCAAVFSYTPQVRPGYLFFEILLFVVIIFQFLKSEIERTIKAFFSFIAVIIFLLPFLYNLTANYTIYNKFSPLTVDNLFVREFYISLFVESQNRLKSIPAEVNWIYQEYSKVSSNKEREKMTRKYWHLALDKVRKDPKQFLITRVKKFIYVWEKTYLFPYVNPKIDWLKSAVSWSNRLYLFLGLSGVVISIKQLILREKSADYKKAFFTLTALFLLYTTLLHAFTITDERFSLPAYPLLSVFAGYTAWLILTKFKGIISK